MASEILTTDDLREFKFELLEELKQLLQEKQELPEKKWLRSGEVRKLLDISQGTLQNMRVNGTLPYSKMGGLLYYKSQDIYKILESNKSQSLIRFGNR